MIIDKANAALKRLRKGLRLENKTSQGRIHEIAIGFMAVRGDVGLDS